VRPVGGAARNPARDACGNLTCDGITDHTVFGSSTKLSYVCDCRNHLAAVKDDSGNLVATYTYDALNRRVRKQAWADDEPQVENEDTWTLWDGWQALEE
jgi:YD repeat-containing protein